MLASLIAGGIPAQEGSPGGTPGGNFGGNLGGGAGTTALGSQGETMAFVYRDENGIPHIEAENERDAWYALGYEQARDGLIWIQISCKAARGELTWAIGPSGLMVDCAVKIFGTYDRLAAMTEQQRRTLLAPSNPGIQANFYENCAAYADGVNAYRTAVKHALPNVPSPELDLKTWLAAHHFSSDQATVGQADLSWVYNDPITALDVAAHGAMTCAGMSLLAWPGSLVNSSGGSYSTDDQGPATEPEAVRPPAPLDPAHAEWVLDQMRERLAEIPGAASAFAGSNTFAWSGLYCQDAAGISYPGLLGDPHQGVTGVTPDWAEEFLGARNHLWFAHVKVTPPGASAPALDLLGHFPHGSAASFTSHNRHLAMGGTLGAPNFVDHFLLRLEEDPSGSGQPSQPYRYYSRYHDLNPPTNLAWADVVPHTAPIRRPDGTIMNVPYWRVHSYGVVLPDINAVGKQYVTGVTPPFPLVYGERVTPTQVPRWRAGLPADPEPMRFWSAPYFDNGQLQTSPMVVALRAPIDPAVAGEDMHWQLMRDFWELGHVQDARDALPLTNGGAFAANLCFQDRDGRTFHTVASAIPERGSSLSDFQNKGYDTLDKWVIYSHVFGPVPARHSDDALFDWQFGGYTVPEKPAPLLYLPYPDTSQPFPPTPPTAYKPMVLQDQGTGAAWPYTASPSSGTFWVESGFFSSACNDRIWGDSRKRDDLYRVPGAGFADVQVDNQLFQSVLDNGLAYVSSVVATEGPDRQLIVVSRFTEVAERIIRGGSAGSPPLTPAEMVAFVTTAQLYREKDYAPPPGVSSYNPPLPTAVRQLKEVADHSSYPETVVPISTPPGLTTISGATEEVFESPVVSAQREVDFFNDFWQALFVGSVGGVTTTWSQHVVQGSSPPITLDLRDLWVQASVAGHQDQVFWYDDPANPATLRWVDLPPGFPLIDFYWPGSHIGDGRTVEDLLVSGALASLASDAATLVNGVLVPWDATPHYQNLPSSTGACLLEMMRQGFDASGEFGRHWIRLRNGMVEQSGNPSQWVPLDASGMMPASVVDPVQQVKEWDSVGALAFPPSQMASLLRVQDNVRVPYDALYDASGNVKATLAPADCNAFVRFFLQLGGHYVDPASNNGNPSRKLARFEQLGSDEDVFRKRGHAGGYPLTDGLRRIAVLQRLLDTEAFFHTFTSGVPPFSTCFRARAYDHTSTDSGQRVWPDPTGTAEDMDCVGGGLRAVKWHGLKYLTSGSVYVEDRGFQEKFLGLGGSIAAMAALFPSGPGMVVDSRFWSTPGEQAMTSDPRRFDTHMQAWSTNVLLPTHYEDYRMNYVALYVHAPY